MPPNRRGKIKEHLEGMHKNTEAYKAHCVTCLEMIGPDSFQVMVSFNKLVELAEMLDDFTLALYSKI